MDSPAAASKCRHRVTDLKARQPGFPATTTRAAATRGLLLLSYRRLASCGCAQSDPLSPRIHAPVPACVPHPRRGITPAAAPVVRSGGCGYCTARHPWGVAPRTLAPRRAPSLILLPCRTPEPTDLHWRRCQ